MSIMQLTYNDFDITILKSDNFITNENGNNLVELINKWNKYIELNNSNKRLKIKKLLLSQFFSDIRLININVENIKCNNEMKELFIYLNNSNIGNIEFNNPQNSIKKIVIEGKRDIINYSKINTLSIDNIHFLSDNEVYMDIVNLFQDIEGQWYKFRNPQINLNNMVPKMNFINGFLKGKLLDEEPNYLKNHHLLSAINFARILPYAQENDMAYLMKVISDNVINLKNFQV